MSDQKERKSVTFGDVITRTDKATGQAETNEEGVPKEYFLKCWVPDDVDEAGIGQPSIIITKDRYLNFRLLEAKEIDAMPDWKKPLAQLKCWISLKRK